MEVPRQGVELELKLPTYTTATAMPWILVGFVTAEPRWELRALFIEQINEAPTAGELV